MAQKIAEEEEEDWENYLVVEGRAIDTMVSINLEEDLIEDSEYNAVDHVEKQNTNVISMKQETIKNIHTSDMVASIKEIKEINFEQAVPGIIYVDSDLYGESIEEDAWEVEVFDQSPAISRSVIGLDQILEANEENTDQIDGEADLEGPISDEAIDNITFEISKVDKHIIEELKRKSDGVSYFGAEASQEIDDNIIKTSNEEANTNEISQYYGIASEEACSKILSIRVSNLFIIDVSPDSTTAGKLRERRSLGTQRRDNSHGSFNNGKSLSFDEARGVPKKFLRSSPRRGSKLRLSSSTTSMGYFPKNHFKGE
uniref:Uncharacterized protein n=1 Tax=Solanum tuberosum TaxID=4113 RepID=M1DYH8_SOLTU